MRLNYLSSRTPGYKSVLRISLTHPTIPFNLMKVHLMVAVEGRLFRKWFAAAPDLSYYFTWDKTDVYNQKVFGLSEAFGKSPSPGTQRDNGTWRVQGSFLTFSEAHKAWLAFRTFQ